MSVRWSEWGDLEASLFNNEVHRVGMRPVYLHEKFVGSETPYGLMRADNMIFQAICF